ncbi:hypothetical protein [Streptomyces sp. CB02613]|uniref:hypothetical protein n=1 Tax=Streptomyces sp. CB02613 TaxID=2020328 RepID=UPI00131A6C42|nr:hypothetical protein [Streptomyces sp. CB02613]
MAKKTCETCGTKSATVEQMDDPYTAALYPEWPEHDQMTLCPPCAVARYEES